MILDNIEKIYYMKSNDIKALNNINCSFEKGKFYAIMGHSGSGKSTLINILGLIDSYTSGKYTINGKDVTKLSEKELANLRMRNIGFIFQEFYLDENLKAFENVMLPMLINKEIKKSERKTISFKLLKFLGLDNRCYHYPKELSGGEKQRVCLARALANNPDFILADEPTGALDEENEKFVFKTLKELSKQGKCVIVVTHSNIIKNYSDIVINISKGKILEK